MKNAVAFPKRNMNPPGPLPRAIIKACLEMEIDVIGFDYDFEKYDNVLVFHNKPHQIPKKGHIGWWMCDLLAPKRVNTHNQLNHIFLCNTEYAKGYERWGKVHYLPQCGLDEPPALEGPSIDWDVIFIGNFKHRYHRNRWDIMNNLKYKTKIISGQRWTKLSKYYYYSSPFSISINPRKEMYTSNRSYNILSSGGFLLIHKFPGIEKLFENHKHLAWFDTVDEANEIIDYYYNHPEEYAKIRVEGKKLYDKKHTAKARLQNAFAIMEGKETEFTGYL